MTNCPKMRKIIFVIALLFIAACAQSKDFRYGLGQINKLNSKYNLTMETYPGEISRINLLLDDYKELKKLKLEKGQEPFNYIIDYRASNLEAEKSYIQGQKYGNAGTTKYGFGCKTRPLIIESVSFRNMSAQAGFGAVGLLKDFVEKYPNEAGIAGFGQKNVLFLNATFYGIAKDARRDSNTINHFCPINVTLELYRGEFRKRANMSEDFINNLDYEHAVPIWKKVRGIG